VLVVENAVFDGVPDGEYTLCAFPMKIKGLRRRPRAGRVHKAHVPQPRLRFSQTEINSYRITGYGFEVKGEE
jgi:hypothetical protein